MKPVLFVSGLGRTLDRAENIKVIYDAYQGEKCFVSLHDRAYGEELNTGKYGLIVIDVFPTDRRIPTIMIWHGIQGGKHIGLDEKGTYYKEQYADCIDRIVAAGIGGIEMFNQCTGVPKERIVSLGMPRTDRYVGKRKGDGAIPFMAGKRAYLYVPTFRTLKEPQFPMIDWEWLDNELTDDEILVVKAHPYAFAMKVENRKHIVEVPRMDASVNYLYDADVVITDYSSIMFDAYLLKKPVVLFEKRKGYVETRGMYLKYPDEYCSRYAETEQELLRLIRTAKRLTKTERECVDYVADACDGHSCERICKLIEEMI